ncbi:helix-turn-helix domain-containing protein [Bacillus massiliglaciei]|uniref:helix-turn-helix domain-containing protein n=1 Tax=Bacillus massiliglaciei TaxID=1816693 RepID=UPI000A92A857|nr:helix-turn-helix domain-containing protein [Bacillus massiliglaciei]
MNNFRKSTDNCLGAKETAQRLGYASSDSIHHMINTKVFPNAFIFKNRFWIPISDIEVFEKYTDKDNYLDTKEAALRLGYKSSDSIVSLIKEGIFPNAFRFYEKWRIPISEIKAFEQLKAKLNTNCLDTKQAALRLGYKSGNSIIEMVKANRFPNAFKSLGQWWVPLSDIESFEKFVCPPNSLDTKETGMKLGLRKNSIIQLLQEGKFPNAVKVLNKWRIPLNDIEAYRNLKQFDGSLSTTEAAIQLGYSSSSNINYLIKAKRFPNAFSLEGKWRIPVSDIEAFKHAVNTENSLSTIEVAKKLGYKSSASIIDLIKKNNFPNAFTVLGKYRIPLSDVEAHEQQTTLYNCLTSEETAIRLGYKSGQHIGDLIRKDKFPNAFKFNRKWRIPVSDIEAFEQLSNTENCLDTIEASKMLGFKAISSVRLAIEKNRFPNAFKSAHKWWIPMSDITAYLDDKDNHSPKKYKRSKKRLKKRSTPKLPLANNCLDMQEASKRLGYKTNGTVIELINKGKFPNSFKISRQWWIPISDIDAYEKSIKQFSQKYLNTKEASLRLGYSSPGVISRMISEKIFPNAFKQTGQWHIPLKDIEDFEVIQKQSKMKIDYSGKTGFEEIKEFIKSKEHKQELQETKQFYLDYCLLQTNNISGSSGYIKSRVGLFKRFYKRLFSNINKEIYLHTTDEIKSFLDTNSPFTQHEKKLLAQFIKYTYSMKNIKPNEEIVISKKNRKTDSKDIYPAELFHKIYNYIRDTKTHTPVAVKDKYYAHMWVYTILLLTDFIRGQDLITNTPNIDIESLSINTIDWFLENDLSDFQTQLIINQLYIHFRHKRTSKTDELLTFVVAPDLIYPLATSLVISEFHRKMDGSEMLLNTFFQGKYNVIKTEGKIRHKKFFNSVSEFKEFHFSSQKMNNSVGTYLFYSITEEDGYDGELALHLTQTARSHKSPETTSVYIQATNKDGSINRVSYNLFRRGHFGWLYNYLILYASQYNQINNTMEERTKLIENIRQEMSPTALENLSKFIENYLTLVPLNNKAKNMDDYLTDIYQKRQSVISKLIDYSYDEIKEIIIKLSKGRMPSKNEHAQCFVHPNCKYPQLANCYSCEYVIPQNLLLIQLTEELNRLLDNIESYTNELLIMKDTKFLLHCLLIWKEARLTHGEETVNAFIPTEETWRRIENLAHKLHIE